MDILEEIDNAISDRCACGCGETLAPDGPSAYYVDAGHQRRWQEQQATDPADVYRRPDAALYPAWDSAEVGLYEGPTGRTDELSAPTPRGRFRRFEVTTSGAAPLATWRDETSPFARYYMNDIVFASTFTGPAIVLDRREPSTEPAWTSDVRDPATAAGGLNLADYGYRRHCHRCGRMGVPRLWREMPLVRFDFAFDPNHNIADLETRTGHGCPYGCGIYQGPPMWATVERDADDVILRLSDDPSTGWVVLVAHDPASIGHWSVRNVMDLRWQEAFYHLEDYRRPSCVMADCDEKARETFVVQQRDSRLFGRLHLCGRAWDAGDKIELCPEHAYQLHRGEDPASPGVQRDDYPTIVNA